MDRDKIGEGRVKNDVIADRKVGGRFGETEEITGPPRKMIQRFDVMEVWCMRREICRRTRTAMIQL